MGYSNGRIVAPVSVRDVQQALGVSSGDVATLCTHANINLWARYRPIPCTSAGNNKPALLTPAQRLSERYGVAEPIDMYTADDATAYETYANKLSKRGPTYIELRPWGSTHWKRLADFVKTDGNGNKTSYGYDHKAQMDNVKVNLTSGTPTGTFVLTPLIPAEQRTIVIPPNSTDARYHFPNDHLWMNRYYQWVQNNNTTGINVERNEEWLSPIDFMGFNQYKNLSYSSVLRRIIILRWEDSQHRKEGDTYYQANDAKWRFYNYATDTVGGNSVTRPFATYPKAWLDLTDSEQNLNNSSNIGGRRLKDLVGRCLFIDAWVQDNSYINCFPILGFAYEVNIRRDNIEISVDVTNKLSFWYVECIESTQNGNFVYDYDVYLSYNTDTINLNGNLENAGATVVPILQQYYDSLSITIGGQTINMLNTSLEYYTDTNGEGNWFAIHLIPFTGVSSNYSGQTATVTASRKNTGISSTKQIQIHT